MKDLGEVRSANLPAASSSGLYRVSLPGMNSRNRLDGGGALHCHRTVCGSRAPASANLALSCGTKSLTVRM